MEDPEEVNYEMVSFFQKLLGVNSNFAELNEERLNAAISKRLGVQQRTGWLKKVSDEEVRYAMFSLKDNKTPRPDA